MSGAKPLVTAPSMLVPRRILGLVGERWGRGDDVQRLVIGRGSGSRPGWLQLALNEQRQSKARLRYFIYSVVDDSGSEHLPSSKRFLDEAAMNPFDDEPQLAEAIDLSESDRRYVEDRAVEAGELAVASNEVGMPLPSTPEAEPPKVSSNPFSLDSIDGSGSLVVQIPVHSLPENVSNPFDTPSLVASPLLAAVEEAVSIAPKDHLPSTAVLSFEATAPAASSTTPQSAADAETPPPVRESEISPIQVIPPTFEEDMLAGCARLLASGRHHDIVFQLTDGSLAAHRVLIEARCGQHVVQAARHRPI